MVRENRIKIRSGHSKSWSDKEVDLKFTGYSMQELKEHTGITNKRPDNTWITARKIKRVIGRVGSDYGISNNDIKLNRRINLLVKKGFLKSKPMPKKSKIKIYGSSWKNVNIYTMGSRGRSYLKRWGDFDNSKAPLMQKGLFDKKEEVLEEPEIKSEPDEYAYVLE